MEETGGPWNNHRPWIGDHFPAKCRRQESHPALWWQTRVIQAPFPILTRCWTECNQKANHWWISFLWSHVAKLVFFFLNSVSVFKKLQLLLRSPLLLFYWFGLYFSGGALLANRTIFIQVSCFFCLSLINIDTLLEVCTN